MPKSMAQYPEIESKGSIGSFVLGLYCLCSLFGILSHSFVYSGGPGRPPELLHAVGAARAQRLVVGNLSDFSE